jgi:hypothetical protein
MDCNGFQAIIQKLHTAGEADNVGDVHTDLAFEHVRTCGQCQTWFNQNMCPQVQNENDEDVCMMHGMLHEPMGTECQFS